MEFNETTETSNIASIFGGTTFDSTMEDEEDGSEELTRNNDSNAATILIKYYGKLMHHPVLNSFNLSREYIESTLEPDAGDLDDVSMSTTVSTIVVLVKALIIGFIILAAIFGNMLVIVSVMQHRRLRYVFSKLDEILNYISNVLMHIFCTFCARYMS